MSSSAALSREEFELLTDIVDRLIDSGARAVALQSYLLAKLARDPNVG